MGAACYDALAMVSAQPARPRPAPPLPTQHGLAVAGRGGPASGCFALPDSERFRARGCGCAGAARDKRLGQRTGALFSPPAPFHCPAQVSPDVRYCGVVAPPSPLPDPVW